MTDRCFDQNRRDHTDSGCLRAVLWEVDMVQATICRFGAIRALVLVGLLGIGLIASTAVPAVGSSNTWAATGSMTITRGNHTATLLPNGKVLVAGGLCSGGFTYPDHSGELYDPSTGTWKATGSMNVARANTAATLLTKGQVLTAGGNPTSSGARSAELYAHGHWTMTGSMNVYRPNLAATLLTNGDVLVFGGTGLASSASEFYNPVKKTWTMTGQYYVAPSISGHT